MFNNVQGNSPSRPSQETPPSKLMGGSGASIRVKGNNVACAKHRRRQDRGSGYKKCRARIQCLSSSPMEDYSVSRELRSPVRASRRAQ